MMILIFSFETLLLLIFFLLRNDAFVIRTATTTGVIIKKLKQQQQQKLKERRRIRGRIISTQLHETKENDVDTTTISTAASSSTSKELPDTSQPLLPHSFAGMVEQALIDKFSIHGNIDRIVQSWRLLELGYEHKEFVGYHQNPPISGEESDCHQHAHSYVPGLRPVQFYNTDSYDWCSKLVAKYPKIKKEFDKANAMKNKEQLQKEGNNVWAGALTEDASSYGTGWKTLVLMDRGIWDSTNVNLFPETATAIKELNVPATEVFFASMDASSTIDLHSDFTNFVVTSHLGLDIPDGKCCSLTIGDETRYWENGQLLMFDTSILHSAKNESPNQTRYILMMRLWHPDLTEIERNALQFLYDCLTLPELANPDPTVRFQAELEMQSIKAFPTIDKKRERNNDGGFSGMGSGSGGGNKKKKKKKKGRKK